MSVVSRKSIHLQIQENRSWATMSEDDRAVCVALYEAIQALQNPSLFGELPDSVRKSVLRWRGARVRAYKTSPETIRAQLKFAEALGLKRTRSEARTQEHKRRGPTAFEWVADRLRISRNTVANKAARQLPKTTRTR